MASVRGAVRTSILDRPIEPLLVGIARLAPVDSGTAPVDVGVSRGGFEFSDVAPGWYILSVFAEGFQETVHAIRVVDGSNDAGTIDVRFRQCSETASLVCDTWGEIPGLPRSRSVCLRDTLVLTVGEALKGGLGYPCSHPVVIIGIFKSGMDETLRLDCPTQLVSGDVGWPSAIGLTNPSPPPEALRAEIEKKRQEVLKSSPPEAPLRPERLVGLCGYLVSPAGLTTAACCTAQVETVLPPARLFGVTETDRRVIR